MFGTKGAAEKINVFVDVQHHFFFEVVFFFIMIKNKDSSRSILRSPKTFAFVSFLGCLMYFYINATSIELKVDASIDTIVTAVTDKVVSKMKVIIHNEIIKAVTDATDKITDEIAGTLSNDANSITSPTTERKTDVEKLKYASQMQKNFGADVKMPDDQFKKHLETTRSRERHVPSRKEVLEYVYRMTEDEGAKFYDGYVFPSDHAVRFPVSKYVSNFVRDHADVFFLIESLLPKNEGSINFIVEAGSFVGSSANMWAKLARKHNATVLCIDTWEGDVNMWTLPNFVDPMSIKYGRSHLYDNFIQNIIDGGVTDVVLPLAASSIVGAKVLYAQKIMVDVVYIDTAHEQGETLGEMFVYWELLRPGGVMLGDDYNYFPAVKHDVDIFVKYMGVALKFTKSGKSFAIKKPFNN